MFGGNGPYISHIKSRRAYHDLLQFDTVTKRWFEDKRAPKGALPAKRINHAGDVLGCVLAVFGGFETEQRRVLDDLALFDLEEHAWIHGDIKYPKRDPDRLCARAKHSVTTVYSHTESVKWGRRLWFDKKF